MLRQASLHRVKDTFWRLKGNVQVTREHQQMKEIHTYAMYIYTSASMKRLLAKSEIGVGLSVCTHGPLSE